MGLIKLHEARTWRPTIESEMVEHKESWDDVEHRTLTDEELDYDGRGYSEEFYIWTAKRVYYYAEYDGWEWCDSMPRHPCNKANTVDKGADSD